MINCKEQSQQLFIITFFKIKTNIPKNQKKEPSILIENSF